MIDEVQFIFERIWRATKNISDKEIYLSIENID